jgi:hypothetical protein
MQHVVFIMHLGGLAANMIRGEQFLKLTHSITHISDLPQKTNTLTYPVIFANDTK